MIDFHIITYGSRDDWLSSATESVRRGGGNVHLVDGYKDQIGRGRAEGLVTGVESLVSFVDPDDWVEPDVLSACRLVFEANPKVGVVCTGEVVVDESGENVLSGPHIPSRPVNGHHLVVYRRKAIRDDFLGRLSQVNMGEIHFLNSMVIKEAGWRGVVLPVTGYYWRQHQGQMHRGGGVSHDS